MSAAVLYEIVPSAKAGSVNAINVWTNSDGRIVAGLKSLVRFPWHDGVLLLGQASDNSVHSYKLTAASPFVVPLTSNFDLGGPCDILKSFVIGGVQHLIAYRAASGKLSFHRVNADMTLSKPYVYYRLRSPGLTTGWTVMEPIIFLNMVYYVSYEMKTGAVELFSIYMTATGEGDCPPLQSLNVWSWQWAQGWTHFAFFQLGGENFFFKINVGTSPNVNIDHLSLDPNLRSNEVCTRMNKQMPNNQDPTLIIRSLILDQGTPYLVNYLPGTGATNFYRVHADCQGWSSESPVDTITIPGASDIVTYQLGGRSFALFY
jgi:hypothetical protein